MVICNPLAQGEIFRDIKGVIFDCDGVLIDSKDSNRMYYNIIRAKMGMLSMTPEEEEYVHMHAVSKSLARIVPPERLAEAESLRRAMDYREIMPYIYLQPNLVSLLDYLFRQGIKMAVNTNRTDSMNLVLDTFDLRRFFSPVITAGKVSRPKPSAEGVHKILWQWQISRDCVVYIGDSLLDELTARGAGVRFWAYKNSALKAALHIEDFEVLRQCLARAQ